MMALLLFFLVSVAFSDLYRLPEKDLKGSQDHPAVGRVEGARIAGYTVKDYDVLRVPTKIDYSWGRIKGFKELEGKVTRIYYVAPKTLSPIAVQRAYRKGLEAKGFRVLYNCAPCTRSNAALFMELMEKLGESKWDALPPRKLSFLLMKGSYRGREVHVALYTYTLSGLTQIRLRIVESKPLKLGLKVVKAEEIKKRIEERGSVSIYGIHFDHNSAVVKPESEKALREIAKYLKRNPKVKLYVVGHTDNTGGYEYNLKLSLRRAEAVVRKLVKKYGISPNRLKAVGVGPVAPVDTNRTPEGRARNRRVELVEM